MRFFRATFVLLLFSAVVGACGGYVRKEIEGNSTGGVIPPALVASGNTQAAANAHCAKWNTTARITFSGAEAGGDTVFVCETCADASDLPHRRSLTGSYRQSPLRHRSFLRK
jgi:hypothetical protein